MTTPSSSASRRRAVFLDVDGTILADGKHIDPSTIEAIRGARDNGHLVFLSTGRATAELTADLLDIGFDGAVTNGGGFAAFGDEVIVSNYFTPEQVRQLAEFLKARGIHWYFQSYDKLFASPELHELIAQLSAIDAAPSDIRSGFAAKKFADAEDFDETAMSKMVVLSDDGGVLDDALAKLDGEYSVVTGTIPVPFLHSGEVSPPGVNKGATILGLLDHLGVSADDAIGIGDNWNDVEMFEVCGVSVAMGNADPAVQALADHVTTAVLDAGIWNAFARLGLLGSSL